MAVCAGGGAAGRALTTDDRVHALRLRCGLNPTNRAADPAVLRWPRANRALLLWPYHQRQVADPEMVTMMELFSNPENQALLKVGGGAGTEACLLAGWLVAVRRPAGRPASQAGAKRSRQQPPRPCVRAPVLVCRACSCVCNCIGWLVGPSGGVPSPNGTTDSLIV